MDNQLKIFALEYVKLHDDLIKEEKLAIGQFIMEASNDQVKFLLATGEVKDKLTTEDSELVESWDSQWLNTGQQVGIFASGVQAAVAAALVIKAGTMAYKRFFSQAAKSCTGKSGSEKTDCIQKFKDKAKQAKVKTLRSGLGKCSKSKNPEKCKAKINKELARTGSM